MPKIISKAKKEEYKAYIIKELAVGLSLVQILRNNKDRISQQNVYNWLNKNHKDFDANFLDNYTRAREQQADYYADEIVNIADTEPDPAKARVRIEARKWVAGKMRPKIYGDRIINENENKNINIELTREERDAELAAILKRLKK